VTALSESALAGIARIRAEKAAERELFALIHSKPDFPVKYMIHVLVKLEEINKSYVAFNFCELFTPITEDGYLEYKVPRYAIRNLFGLGRLAKVFGTVPSVVYNWLQFWDTPEIQIEGDAELMTPHQEVEIKMAGLRAALLADTPQLPTILSQIKMYLSKNPEVVTILSEDEIGEIVRAAQHTAKVKLVENAVKAKGKKALKDTELEDLM